MWNTARREDTLIESNAVEVAQAVAIQTWIFDTRADFYVGVPAGLLAAFAMMVFACFKRAPRFLWSISFALFSLPLLVVVFAQRYPSLPYFLATVLGCGFLALLRPPNPKRWYTRLAVALISLAMFSVVLAYFAVIFCAAAGGAGLDCRAIAKGYLDHFLWQLGLERG